MDEYIASIETAMSEVQNEALESFVSQAENTGYSISVSPDQGGTKTFSPPSKPTDPTQYNSAISAAIADLTGLYEGLDTISGSANALDCVNRSQLARVDAEVERLEGALGNVQDLSSTTADYTHVVHKDFISNDGDPASLPQGLSRLAVDHEISALTRPLAMSVTRVSSLDKESMCRVSIENMLGTSAEARHPIAQAIDGDISTYWREIIISDVPIGANKDTVDWLKHTNYSGGAAVQVRFDFEAVTPISEICIKPLADYPPEVLGVAWSTNSTTNKDAGGAVNINGNFDTWPDTAHWTTQSIGAPTVSNPAEGNDGTKCLKVAFSGSSSSRYILSQTVSALQAGAAYQLSFYAKSSTGRGQAIIEVSCNSGKSILFRNSPTISTRWAFYNYIVTMPPSMSDAAVLTIKLYDSGTLWFDNLQINDTCASLVPETIEGAHKSIIIALSQSYGKPVMCRTLWVTLVQPNYALEHFSVPRSITTSNDLWAAAIDGVDPEASPWSSMTSPWRRKDDLLPAGVTQSSPLAAAAQKLGGKVKSLLARMIRLTGDADEVVDVVKYVYTIGAWEIDIRYKDFAPQGYWVSKPLNVRGEIRQITLVPTVGPIEADKVNFYLLPRADSAIDLSNAYCLNTNWTVYFKALSESSVLTRNLDPQAENIISLQPIHVQTERFEGTDRYKKTVLANYPYFNTERAWAIHTKITTGSANKQNHYDPNAMAPLYADTAGTTAVVRAETGYAPLKVTLRTAEQTVPPDLIGKSHYTQYEIVSGETLACLGDATTITDTKTTTTETGGTASESTVRKVKVYKTNKPICFIEGVGPKIALYWHKANTNRDADELIDPKNYTIRWEKTLTGLTTPGYTATSKSVNYADTIELVVDNDRSGPEYTVVAYYRTEGPGSVAVDEDYVFVDADGNRPRYGLTALALQSYPVTRNVTDYLTGNTPTLRPAVLDRTSSDYYPIYEYYIDESGSLVFANDLSKYGDNAAIIEVEYDTLAINPRLLIEYAAPEVGSSTCSTPLLTNYTILINAKT